MHKFSDRLEKAMKIRKLKQSELAAKANLNRSAISHYVSGYYKPKKDKIQKMAKVLEVNEEWLLGNDVPMSPKVLTTDEALRIAGCQIMDDDDIWFMEEGEDYLIKEELKDKIDKSSPQQCWNLRDKYDYIISLDSIDWEMLELLNQLNSIGKEKSLEYLTDLNKISEYVTATNMEDIRNRE